MRLNDLGAEAMPLSSEALNTLVAQESAKWGKIIADTKITAEDLR